ncbi:hypothetical protein [Pseudomonas graminis]|uniref:Uncharacterized protein n=1 Tax=Pseudomonas graminis TaxID=158627 RepID=A0A1C2DR83_9PSED|nr:hypothetical protein [Pseudomonas graminis]OCX17291.1 hypothetical protein BBI10_17375 [Pseudomonas graminis]
MIEDNRICLARDNASCLGAPSTAGGKPGATCQRTKSEIHQMEEAAAAKHAAAYRLRQKEKKDRLGIATVTIEVAQGVASKLPDLLKMHGFDNE